MRKHALVVHPDRGTRILLERWLHSEGYLPQSVRRGSDAVILAKHATVDLIVLDRKAPHSECSDVILGLMTDPKSACIPIAFANGNSEDLPILATSRTVH
jgi:DNA-binding response OmpR family regulator